MPDKPIDPEAEAATAVALVNFEMMANLPDDEFVASTAYQHPVMQEACDLAVRMSEFVQAAQPQAIAVVIAVAILNRLYGERTLLAASQGPSEETGRRLFAVLSRIATRVADLDFTPGPLRPDADAEEPPLTH